MKETCRKQVSPEKNMAMVGWTIFVILPESSLLCKKGVILIGNKPGRWRNKNLIKEKAVKRITITVLLALMLTMVVAMPVFAGGNGAERGVCTDQNALWLGDITYLANNSGGHLWFTPTANGGPYIAGHRYHNVYKYKVDDPSEWAIVPVVPDRMPYNKIATPGQPIYYKIFDTTMDTQVRP